MLKNFYVKIFFKLFPAERLRRSGAKVGKKVFFGENFYAELENAKYLEIGDRAVFAAFTKIILHDSSLNNIDTFPVLYGKVIIGKNVYVGADTIILPGTKIGDNTIIGAGSLVKGILRPDSVYAGRPARYLESVKVLKSKWKKRKNKLVYLKNMKRWRDLYK